MTVLSRIPDDASRSLAPIRAVRLAGDRAGQGDARRIGGDAREIGTARFREDEVEFLGVRGEGRGRTVVSMPSSAFFAQYLGQHPEARNARHEQLTADIAYRDALDLGVAIDRPTPLSLAV